MEIFKYEDIDSDDITLEINLKFNEYEEGKTEKSLKKIFEIADAIMID